MKFCAYPLEAFTESGFLASLLAELVMFCVLVLLAAFQVGFSSSLHKDGLGIIFTAFFGVFEKLLNFFA